MPATIDRFIDTYFPQYIHQYFSVSLASGWTLNVIVISVAIVGVIAFGALSDLIGRKKLLVLSAGCFLCFSYPLLSLLLLNQWSGVVLVVLLVALTLSIYEGPLPALLVKLPPLQVRYTVFGLGYNIAYALFAGSGPLIFSLLVKLSPLFPALYFMLLASLSLLVLYFLWKNQH